MKQGKIYRLIEIGARLLGKPSEEKVQSGTLGLYEYVSYASLGLGVTIFFGLFMAVDACIVNPLHYAKAALVNRINRIRVTI